MNCLNCNEELIIGRHKKKKFCNNSCSASYNNKNNKRVLNEKHNINCISCGNENPTKYQKYCSKTCHQNFLRKKKLESGDLGPRGIKQYLIRLHGNKCQICGWAEVNIYTGNIPIELEHIDGNSENNELENLILLCPNHHSLTSTYKGANRGNGRHKRLSRYHDDKSY